MTGMVQTIKVLKYVKISYKNFLKNLKGRRTIQTLIYSSQLKTKHNHNQTNNFAWIKSFCLFGFCFF